MSENTLSVVVPLFNEEASIREFHYRLDSVLQGLLPSFEIIYVDDGSTDRTLDILLDISKDDPFTVIQLSRNFGHQAALTAGIDLAEGEMVITLDGDGQHPPELIPSMIAKCQEGFDIVQMQRVNDSKVPLIKRATSDLFYWTINKLGDTRIEPGTSDFRLMTRKVVLAMRELREVHRIIRGMIPWLGFSKTEIPYHPDRRIGGKSKYTFRKMFSLAENAIFSFSLVPLRIGLFAGVFFLLLALIEAVYVLSFWVTGRQHLLAPGWSSIVFLILVSAGFLMVLISVLGIYIGQIFQEVKGRPLYIVQKIFNQSKVTVEKKRINEFDTLGDSGI